MVPPLAVVVPVNELAGGNALEVPPVLGLAVALGAGRQRLAVDPAVLVGDGSDPPLPFEHCLSTSVC